MKITTLVADDEPLARRKLSDLIAEVPWATQVGEAADGRAALDAALELQPDVLFLDIRMPELDGLQVVEGLAQHDHSPAVIFTTAFDQYAITAFELEALDYLLKPFGMRRLLAALERARDALGQSSAAPAPERVRAAINPGETVMSDHVFVREGNTIRPLSLTIIERIEAQDDYSALHSSAGRHLVGVRLSALADWLPNPPFLRVHRSHIVNMNHVERLVGLDDSRFDVEMKSGTVIRASRARSQEIRRLAR